MRSITVHELKAVVEQGEAVVVDVREPGSSPRATCPAPGWCRWPRCPALVGDLPTDQPVYLSAPWAPAAGRRRLPGPARRRRGERRRRHRRLAGRRLPGRALTRRATHATAGDAPGMPGFDTRRARPVASSRLPDPPGRRTSGRRILPRSRSRSTDAWQERGTHDSWALRGPRGEAAPVERPGRPGISRPNPTAHLVGVGEDPACPSTVGRRACSVSATFASHSPLQLSIAAGVAGTLSVTGTVVASAADSTTVGARGPRRQVGPRSSPQNAVGPLDDHRRSSRSRTP